MTSTHTYAVVDLTTYDTVKDDLVQVVRKPEEHFAYFLPSGHYKVMTAHGEEKCEGPVWIMWDAAGYPHSMTPTEFEALYTKRSSDR